MTHEELGELYELYALGVLESEEAAEVERHLARNCPECQTGVRRALGLTAMLGAFPEPVAPPRRLRARILAGVGASADWKGKLWLGGLAYTCACLVAAIVLVSVENTRRAEQLASTQTQLRQSSNDLTQARRRLDSVSQFLNSPETLQVQFGQGQPLPPKGRIFVNARRGVLLMASNLPAAPSGKIYEMWLLPRSGAAPIPAGLFQSDSTGAALYLRNEPIDPAAYKAVAVTLEPAQGSTSPTMPILIAAAL